MYKNIYFLHIPKTAGRYLYSNILLSLEKELLANLIRLDVQGFKNVSAHQQWCLPVIDDNTYILSSMRDPAKHLVSYYCHINSLSSSGARTVPIKSKPINRVSFLNWLDSNTYMSDYQVKNFLFDTNDTSSKIPTRELGQVNTDNPLLEKRLKRINIMVRAEDLTEKNTVLLRKKIALDLGLSLNTVSSNVMEDPEWKNEDSDYLYSQLTDADIQKIYAFSPIDKKIYDNDSYFWQPK